MANNHMPATIPLSETTKFIVDNRGRTAPTAERGIPLIATNCISNQRLYPAYENLRYVSQETYENWFRSHPQPWDIILTNKGSQNGAICLVPDPVDFVIAQDMVALRADENIIDPLFLFAVLRSPDVQRQIKNLDVSGVIPHFKKTDFDKLFLPYPARHVQESIGRIYFDLCAKIELNRRMNATLESMARALFQSWFVDFDPVRAKLDGRPPAALDPATAALFPAHFDHKAEGVVPTGWRATTLGEVIEISDSKRIPLSGREREARKGKYPYHGAASVMDYVDDFLFDGIYALMGEDGSVINEDGTPVLQYVWGKFWVNNHAHVLRGKNGISTEHLLLHLKGSNIAPFVNGAVQPKLNQGNMNRIPFMLPPPEIGQAFAKAIEPLFAQIRANTDQSRTLATLRDTLLPKLLSGKLSVGTVDCTMEEVL
jgi:type I restriction enzyme S subunit